MIFITAKKLRNPFPSESAVFKAGCTHLAITHSVRIYTKGPQLISETNIPLLIPEWWRLCTDIKTAYASVYGNEFVHV